MIQGLPSAIWGLDSRVEYDLNRPPEIALPLTPEQFWGTWAYRITPTDAMNARSMAKYHAFHRFIGSYLHAVIARHGVCVVYDIHSYNISRQVEKGVKHPPVFNLGSVLLDRKKWGVHIESWLQQLKAIDLPGLETTVAENQVFFGRAHFCSSLNDSGENVLVLPTEISKIYMNEQEGTLKPPIVDALQQGLQRAIKQHTLLFSRSTFRAC